MRSQPYKGKIVFYPERLDYSERLNRARSVSYNVNLLAGNNFFVDFGDWSHQAMHEEQWGALFKGDEAYAGSKNFLKIWDILNRWFSRCYVVPTHAERGADHLLFRALEPKSVKAVNPTISFDALRDYFGIPESDNPDLVYFVPASLEDMDSEVGSGRIKVANITGVLPLAFVKGVSVKEWLEKFDVLILSCPEALFSHVGALIITGNEDIYRKFQTWVVSFEGLHTYGGLSGRDMEVIAEGLLMLENNVDQWRWRLQEIDYISSKLDSLRIPYEWTGRSWRLSVREPLAFNLALFLSGQVRGWATNSHLFLNFPARRYTREHIDYFFKVLEYVAGQELPVLEMDSEEVQYNPSESASFVATSLPRYKVLEFEGFPYNFKGVEMLIHRTKEYRRKSIEEAGYNTFLLKSEDVYIDLLTDSGTSAMSDDQWAKAIELDWKDAYEHLTESVYDVFGFDLFVPTHQGRQAEFLISQALIKPNQYVINNMYFTTTRFHQEFAGGIFVDMIIPEAHNPSKEHPFKGNLDVERIEEFIKEKGADKIAYICVEANVNMAGGQPVSIDNLRRLRKVADEYGIKIVFDATRIAENAYFIKEREPEFASWSIKDIIREMLSYADAATISAKKDPLTNISGLLLVRDYEIYDWIRRHIPVVDGTAYDGGLAERDLAFLAYGLREMTDYEYLASRIKQVQYLGNRLIEEGIPIVRPIGGHAVYLDAKAIMEHIPQDRFPAQVLAAEIYVEGGVRTMERGTVSAGRDPETGENRKPALELVRMTIPRRVYTNEHMEQVVESVVGVYNRRHELKGLEFTYEPPFLRFFTARFKPVG